MGTVNTLVITGYGTNSHLETATPPVSRVPTALTSCIFPTSWPPKSA